MSRFLVIGGTGKVGRRVAVALREAGQEPRVASRSGGDVRFDWHRPETYAPALAGVEGVFLVGPGSANDWSGLLTSFLTAAETAGVRRVVLLSARGVEFLPDGVVARVEQTLRRTPAGLEWTILRPAHFAQNFTEAMFVPVAGEVAAPVAAGAEPFVDVLDIAEVATEVLIGGRYAGQTIELSGPAPLTFDQALRVLSEVTGQPLRYLAESAPAHVERLRSAGLPEGYVTWRMAMLGGIARGEDAYLSHGVAQVLGRPATDFATWAAREATGPAVERS